MDYKLHKVFLKNKNFQPLYKKCNVKNRLHQGKGTCAVMPLLLLGAVAAAFGAADAVYPRAKASAGEQAPRSRHNPHTLPTHSRHSPYLPHLAQGTVVTGCLETKFLSCIDHRRVKPGRCKLQVVGSGQPDTL